MSMGVSPPPSPGTCSGLRRHRDPRVGGPGGRGPGPFLLWRGPRGGGLESVPLALITRCLRWGPAGLAGPWGGEAGLAGTSPLVGGQGHGVAARPGRGAQGRGR